MKIQSLSLDVPAPCLNKCKFCVAHMHGDEYKKQLDENKPFYDLYLEHFERRLHFARDNGCNTLMITGNGEPLLNRRYLEVFSIINKKLPNPFQWIELQTSGTTLDRNYLRFLMNTVWVNVISLSLSSVFDSERNASINQTKQGFDIDIDQLCAWIKEYDFTLRLSLNMTTDYDAYSTKEIIDRCKALGADQITFRKLYSSNQGTPEDEWVKEHGMSDAAMARLHDYIVFNGRPLRKLEFGATAYSIEGMSVVLDEDCMSTESKDDGAVKYLILRPDCKLYSLWDDKASLLF